MYDLHTHTTMSDGELLPTELVRRAAVLGYSTVAITDHADASNIYGLIKAVNAIKKSANLFGVNLLAGVEITHVPPEEIGELAKEAKKNGADIVIVHGETVVEPVAPGTNLAACTSDYVDILAHPGLISGEEAIEARRHNVALEITSRGGHNRTNGHVLKSAMKSGCRIVVNSDTHGPSDLLTGNARKMVAMGAGMTSDEADNILSDNNLDEIIEL
ncbi:histidinol phosphatase-like PHP family hydrolase [Methanomicrobium sp. W14]|uniref:histidinol phosphate phosphatase domain-containing protein n=1 Tax=Methanomicrobium sp. W14 TaxID=2817839 RepID=UPI001AE851B9|nr:histidinol phosphate phosphatase domain-containing protein [Methanomicrobium sp. W14]MBP2133089.1 histidinol phosphatase-like PHP family hydrolase [Methanomicrobium sp. W14]